MKTVDDLIADVLEREGGFTDHPADKGGPTMRGVTIATYRDFVGRRVSVEEMRQALACRHGQSDCRTCEGCQLAHRLFRKRYVEQHGLEMISPPELQALMVDWCVTSWIDDPVRALQRILRVPVDGRLGPRTLLALSRAGKGVYAEMVKARMRQLVAEALDDAAVQAFLEANPRTDLHNLRGWVNRALEFVG